MISALRYESVRIRTLRSTYWIIGLALGLTTAVAFIVAFAERNNDPSAVMTATVLTGGGEFATFLPFFMAIIGIFAAGHEYRHGTIQPTLTAIPQRTSLLLAKAAVVLVTALVVTAISIVLNAAVGMLFWDSMPDLGASPISDVILGYFAFVSIYALLGLGLAQLFRALPAALVILMVMPFLVEPLLGGLANIDALSWLEPALPYLPFMAGQQLITAESVSVDMGGFSVDYLDRWASGGVFAGFMAIIFIVSLVLFKKRDA